MTKHEFVEYVKTHKKEIAVGALCVVGTGVLVAFGVKGLRSNKIDGYLVEYIDENVVDGFTTGKVTSLWNEGEFTNAIVNHFTIKDMGILGEDLKKIEGITDDTTVDAIFGFANKKIEI